MIVVCSKEEYKQTFDWKKQTRRSGRDLEVEESHLLALLQACAHAAWCGCVRR